MNVLREQLFAVLAIGCVYSLENVGFVLVLRTTGVFNFAQGGIMSLGPFVALDLEGYQKPSSMSFCGSRSNCY